MWMLDKNVGGPVGGYLILQYSATATLFEVLADLKRMNITSGFTDRAMFSYSVSMGLGLWRYSKTMSPPKMMIF